MENDIVTMSGIMLQSRNIIENDILSKLDRAVKEIISGFSPRQSIYGKIANVAGDLVETVGRPGRYLSTPSWLHSQP